MYNALLALYKNPQARIIINDIPTNYFPCEIGNKQGDTLSPNLFSIFANYLSEELSCLNVGIAIDEDKKIY